MGRQAGSLALSLSPLRCPPQGTHRGGDSLDVKSNCPFQEGNHETKSQLEGTGICLGGPCPCPAPLFSQHPGSPRPLQAPCGGGSNDPVIALSLGDGTEVSGGTGCCSQVTLCTWRLAPALNSPKTPRERLSHPKHWDVPRQRRCPLLCPSILPESLRCCKPPGILRLVSESLTLSGDEHVRTWAVGVDPECLCGTRHGDNHGLLRVLAPACLFPQSRKADWSGSL